MLYGGKGRKPIIQLFVGKLILTLYFINYLKDVSFSNCFIGSGDYYYGMTWFESMACCYANHGYMAEPVSQEEHDLIKNRLVMGGYGICCFW